MGVDKQGHPMNDRDLIRVLRALADPNRFRIVQELAQGGELCCGEVVARFGLSQPTISHHLKILADAGILVCRSEGKQHFTSVNEELLSRVAGLIPVRLGSKAGRKPPRRRSTRPRFARSKNLDGAA
jgi:ArsR family transcriptional regulator